MLRLKITPKQESNLDILAALFNNFEIDGIELLEDSLLVYLTDELLNNSLFKESIPKWQSIQPFDFEVEELPNINWNKEWESNFDPVYVEDFLTIRADFHDIEVKSKEVITINPKMSFGTGHHATTWMMSKAMSMLDFQGKKVMDAGTGTGILAILASKLKAKKIIAFDFDPWCYTNSEENIKLNNISNIQLYEGLIEQIKEDNFDIILANINRNFLTTHGELFKEKMNSGSLLMLSGFFHAESKLILDYFSGFNMVAQYLFKKDEWACLILRNTL